MQLPSRDGPCEEDADSVVSDESPELARREGRSAPGREDSNCSGSSVRVLAQESRESSEGAVGGRSSSASCSSNRAIGDGVTSDCGWGAIKFNGYK